MKWEGHVARMGDRRDAYMVLVGRANEGRPLGRRGIILKIVFKMDEEAWIGLLWLRMGTVEGLL